jgi:hypothetical protein
MIKINSFKPWFKKITPKVFYGDKEYFLVDCIEKLVIINGDLKISHYEITLQPVE